MQTDGTGKKITIFTPTYNRGYALDKLYESLLRQTCEDFLWLVIDDGSTDNTEELVRGWQDEHKIEIQYYKQKNQGKTAAHNRGAELTETELFFCVDSDDYLVDDAVEQILRAWESRPDGCIGIIGYQAYEDGTLITRYNGSLTRGIFRDFARDGLKGDTALPIQTDILKKYRYPQFEGENFFPQGYLWDLMGRDGDLLLLKKPIGIVRYMRDGFTGNIARAMYNIPQGYMTAVEHRLRYFDEGFQEKFADSIRYIAMGLAHRKPGLIHNAVYPGIALLAYPGGWLFYCIRYRKIQKEEDKKRRMDEYV